MRTRTDITNGISMCYPHHVRFDHLPKEERYELARSFMGEEAFEALRERARNPRKRQPCQAPERVEDGRFDVST